MKIDRLIGIIAILQQNKKVTAPYLAEKFEVSRRTINRDIEDICRAGIPIVTTQGSNGGISLMEGFSLDTTVFTQQELAAILTGLKTLDSVSQMPKLELLAGKLGSGAVFLFTIITTKVKQTSWWSHISSCSNGRTGMYSASVRSVKIFDCISCAGYGS